MKPLIVIRPEPGCTATVSAAAALGLDAHGFPLSEVRPVAWNPPAAMRFDALLVGSAQVLRHGGAAIAAYRRLPVYAVGEATASDARSAGFSGTIAGNGGLQALLDSLAPDHKCLLRLAGRDRVPLAAPPGVTIEEHIVYESVALAMPGSLAHQLQAPSVVLLHSGEAARHFAAQCDDERIGRDTIALAALAPRIAQAAGSGWADVQWAQAPNDKALLALARVMCQTAPSL